VTTDRDGNARIVNSTVDLGAFEVQSGPTLFATPDPLFFQVACDTITIINGGQSTLIINGISGCDSPPFGIDTSMTVHSLAPGGSTTMLVCLTPPAGNDQCVVTLYSNAWNSPTEVVVILDVVTGIAESTPRPFSIVSVAPNPFNPATTVHFTLPAAMPVTAEIFSVTGARVRVLSRDKFFGPGDNRLTWDGRNDSGEAVATGVYFVQVRTRLGARVMRAVLLK
jgi:hypothetical protein